MSAPPGPLAWTLREFLDRERGQALRHEFDGAQPVAMTGGTVGQAAVAARTIAALARRLPWPCQPMGSAVRIEVAENRIRYPDVVVTCTHPLPLETDILPSPVAVFEVLSPSTAAFDRTVKAAEYAATPSIQVHVMLAQDRPRATIMRRTTAGWEEATVEGLDATLALTEIGIAALPLRELYPAE